MVCGSPGHQIHLPRRELETDGFGPGATTVRTTNGLVHFGMLQPASGRIVKSKVGIGKANTEQTDDGGK